MSSSAPHRPRVVGSSGLITMWHTSIVSLFTLLLVGCGSGGPSVALHEVRGRLEFGGKPPAGAQVVLHPETAEWPLDSLPGATVGDDGSVRVGTVEPGDGAPAGTYVATVQWFRVGPDGSVGGNVLPAKYAAASTSPLRVTVEAAANELPPLKLTR